MTSPSDLLATALREAERRYCDINPLSLTQRKDAAASMPGGNTRTSLFYSPFPLTFVSGRGQRLHDLDGHEYTDFLSEYSAGLYGHSHPVIVAAAQQALHEGIALGGPNTYEAELAALIRERFPSVDLIRFTNSGTEANLMAISTVRVVTGRTKVLVFENSYHGGLLSFRGAAPLNVPYPFVVCRYNDVDQVQAEIERNAADLAAVILEPMLGGGGAIPATAEFIRAIRDSTQQHDVPFILDEVMTSRLSPGGLQEVHGVRPDLTTFGKYLGGGFSFGAFGGAERFMRGYDPTRPDALAHPGTFNNNTITMAAGLAGLRDVLTPDAVRHLNASGDALRARLNALFAERQVCMQATGVGSILGLHFQRAPIRHAGDVAPANAKRALLHLEMINRGYYFARRGYLALSVALDAADHDGFIAAMDEVLLAHHGALADEG